MDEALPGVVQRREAGLATPRVRGPANVARRGRAADTVPPEACRSAAATAQAHPRAVRSSCAGFLPLLLSSKHAHLFSTVLQATERALHFPESAARRLSIEAILRCARPAPTAATAATAAAAAAVHCSGFAVVPARYTRLWLINQTTCWCRGHHGCVNRLCWNETGSLLASGSDDRKVLGDELVLLRSAVAYCGAILL